MPHLSNLLPTDDTRLSKLILFHGKALGGGSPAGGEVSSRRSDLGRATGLSIRFSVVRSPDRLPEILELRRLCEPAGQADPPSQVPHDPRDETSSFVIAEFSGEIIATVRLGPPLAGPIMHHTAELSGPIDGLPRDHEFIEAARACIHPDHRGQGLFWRLVAEMLKAAQDFNRPYLIAGVEQRLWSFWRRCGFKKIGATYRRAHSDAKYFVMVLDLEDVLAGKSIVPELANHLYF